MFIKSVTLKNFRNYENQTIEFNQGLNIVFGKNASGKTNLIESIYCCAIGKSPRTNKYKDLIKWNENFAYIKVVVAKKYRDYNIEFSVDKLDKKRVAIDGIPLSKLAGLIGNLNVIYFSPDEMKLIKESPQERRRFMDISLSQQSKSYLTALSKYNYILAQRNKLLKQKFSLNNLQDQLFIWDTQLAKYGGFIIAQRYAYIDKLLSYASQTHSQLTDNKELLNLQYECSIPRGSQQEIEKNLLETLQKNIEKDANLCYTSIGAHRDDIYISCNDIDIRKFGSQGQQRTTALSLKFAEIQLFKNELGESPVLLLDDVLSELDEARRNQLVKMSANLQTIITCTEFDMDIEHNSIEISNGKKKDNK